jgi:hypothetical protein
VGGVRGGMAALNPFNRRYDEREEEEEREEESVLYSVYEYRHCTV